VKAKHQTTEYASAGLTIVTNVALATGPVLLGAPRLFALNLFFIICKGIY